MEFIGKIVLIFNGNVMCSDFLERKKEDCPRNIVPFSQTIACLALVKTIWRDCILLCWKLMRNVGETKNQQKITFLNKRKVPPNSTGKIEFMIWMWETLMDDNYILSPCTRVLILFFNCYKEMKFTIFLAIFVYNGLLCFSFKSLLFDDWQGFCDFCVVYLCQLEFLLKFSQR